LYVVIDRLLIKSWQRTGWILGWLASPVLMDF